MKTVTVNYVFKKENSDIKISDVEEMIVQAIEQLKKASIIVVRGSYHLNYNGDKG